MFVHIALHDVGWAHSPLFSMVIRIHFIWSAESSHAFHWNSLTTWLTGHVFFGDVLSLRNHWQKFILKQNTRVDFFISLWNPLTEEFLIVFGCRSWKVPFIIAFLLSQFSEKFVCYKSIGSFVANRHGCPNFTLFWVLNITFWPLTLFISQLSLRCHNWIY